MSFPSDSRRFLVVTDSYLYFLNLLSINGVMWGNRPAGDYELFLSTESIDFLSVFNSRSSIISDALGSCATNGDCGVGECASVGFVKHYNDCSFLGVDGRLILI